MSSRPLLEFPKKYFFTIIFLLIGVSVWVYQPKEFLLRGEVMGTTYSVKAYKRLLFSKSDITEQIHAVFQDINEHFSTYADTSEILEFNRHLSTKPLQISETFSELFQVAYALHKETNGAWDGTVKPLLDLWGFSNPDLIPVSLPEEERINEALQRVGFDKIQHMNRALKKQLPELSLEFSSIAKGYAVDQLVLRLEKLGFYSAFVEIGGEVRVLGKKPNGELWKIGVSVPSSDASFDEYNDVLLISNLAVASSGNYRQYFIVDGKQYSHILDPRTGYPVSHQVVGVTVVADTCAYADGLATAMMVMSIDESLTLLEAKNGVEGMLYYVNQDGAMSSRVSSGMTKYLKN